PKTLFHVHESFEWRAPGMCKCNQAATRIAGFVVLQVHYALAALKLNTSSYSPSVRFRLSGLPSNASEQLDCHLLQPEFLGASLWSDSADCEVAVFADSSCSQLIESSSSSYEGDELKRHLLLAEPFDIWVPGHRQASCFKLSLPSALVDGMEHMKALTSSIAVRRGEMFDASFVVRVLEPTTRLEIIVFRRYGPGMQSDSAIIAVGCVFAVLCMVHAAGVAQTERIRRNSLGPVKRASVDAKLMQDASPLANFFLGICLSLEFCLVTLYLVTHDFASLSTMVCTLFALLMPATFVPLLLCRDGPDRTEWLEDYRPQRLMQAESLRLTARHAIENVCKFLVFPVMSLFAMLQRCPGGRLCLTSSLVSAMAIISRGLMSPPIYFAISGAAKDKPAMMAVYTQLLVFQCSLPIVLLIIADLAMQPDPHAASDPVVGLTLTCTLLLLCRQLALYCARVQIKEECEEIGLKVDDESSCVILPEPVDHSVDRIETHDVGLQTEVLEEAYLQIYGHRSSRSSRRSSEVQSEALESSYPESQAEVSNPAIDDMKTLQIPYEAGNASPVDIRNGIFDCPTITYPPQAMSHQISQHPHRDRHEDNKEIVEADPTGRLPGKAMSHQISQHQHRDRHEDNKEIVEADPTGRLPGKAISHQISQHQHQDRNEDNEEIVEADPTGRLPGKELLRRLSRISEQFLHVKANSNEWQAAPRKKQRSRWSLEERTTHKDRQVKKKKKHKEGVLEKE
ncbi:unnamed protein product, partial [Effrenium voratum]